VSEYQYYEFLALDRPLTDMQQAELRKLSSRAEVTATSFTNEYSYGDFRGSPEKLMERYFDAFLYIANWGTRRLMFRLPRALLNAEVARQYCHTDAASVTEASDHVIISLYLDHDPDDYWVEGEGRLGPMAQARTDLATGDLRLLYLAWLLGAQWPDADEDDETAEDDLEPPVPAGLNDLSMSLKAVADFLEIDEDLLAVAAEASGAPCGTRCRWLGRMGRSPSDGGEGHLAGDAGQWRRRAGAGTAAAAVPRKHRRPRWALGLARTAAQLRSAAEDRAEARKKAEEQRRREEQARKAAAKAAAYAKRLDDLAAEGEAAWKRVDDMIATKKTSEYDLAVALLRDLRALTKHQGEDETAAFRKRVLDLRAQYPTRPGLQDRLDRSDMPRAEAR
jgi:hypothetical protein